MDRVDLANIVGALMLVSLMVYAMYRVATDVSTVTIEVKSVNLRTADEDGNPCSPFTVVWGADTSVRHRYWFWGHHNLTRGETYTIVFKPVNPGGGFIKSVEAAA